MGRDNKPDRPCGRYPRGGEIISAIRVKFTLTIILMSMFLFSSLLLPSGSSNDATRGSFDESPQWETFKSNGNRSGKCEYDLESNMGEVLWKKWLSPVLDSSPAIGSDGTIYIGSRDLYLHAVSSHGTLEWGFEVNDEIRSSPTLDRDDNIYFGCLDGNIYSLLPDGRLRWSKFLDSPVYSSPLLLPGNALCVTTEDGRLIYMDRTDGGILWQYETDGAIYSSPALSTNGNILITSRDGYLYSINSSSGLEWKYGSGGPSNSTPALYQGSRIYFTSDDRGIHCVDHYGARIWRYPTWDTGWCSPAVMGHEQVFFGTGEGEIICLGTTGGVRWSFTAVGGVVTSPVISRDNKILFGCKGGAIQCMSDLGAPIWTCYIDGDPASTPAIDNQGNIYIADKEGFLYKIGTRPRTIPSPPRNVRIEIGDLFCKIDWDDPKEDGNLPVEGYTVIREDHITDEIIIAGSTLPEIRTFTDPFVEPGKTYTYYVTAFNSIGDSEPSQSVVGKPYRIPKAPGPPIDLIVSVNDTRVTLQWTSPTDHGTSPITGYHIRWYDSDNYMNGEGYVYDAQMEYTCLVPWKSYYYYFTIASINGVGEGPESEKERVFVPDEDIVIIDPPSNEQTQGSVNTDDMMGVFCCVFVLLILVIVPILLLVLISRSTKNSGKKAPPHMIWRDRTTGKWTTVPPPRSIPIEVRPGHRDRGRGGFGPVLSHHGMQPMKKQRDVKSRTIPSNVPATPTYSPNRSTKAASRSRTESVRKKHGIKIDDRSKAPQLERPQALTDDEKDDFIVERIMELQGMLKDGEIDPGMYVKLKKRLLKQLED